MNPIWILLVVGLQCGGGNCVLDARFLGEYTSQKACEAAALRVRKSSATLTGTPKYADAVQFICTPKHE